MGTMIVWNGEEIREVSTEEGEKLIEKDMAQDMAKEDGLSLKYRSQFTGYKTRELRAEEPPTPVISTPDPVPAGEAEAEDNQDTSNLGAGDEAVSWEAYKDQAKEALGLKRISQEKVELWMADKGII